MPNNMGIVRYVLAISVFIAHFNTLTGCKFYFPVSSFEGVGGFFALSGFLIYGSYLKNPNLKRYLTSRAVRILPAYFTTVLFFAVVLCLISTLSVGEYFGSSQFWKYLIANLSFLNFLEPALPGVFTGFDLHAVNGSLWTMKVEWMLYVSVPLTVWIVCKLKVRRPPVVFIAIYVLSGLYSIGFNAIYESTGNGIWNILARQVFGQLRYFYTGVLIYYYFDEFKKYKWPILIVSTFLYYLGTLSYESNIFLQPLSLSALILWFSMIGKWGTWEGKKDNVSYNIYLLHFPIVQACVHFRLPENIGYVLTFFICCGIIIIMSVLMARFIENPIRRVYTDRKTG